MERDVDIVAELHGVRVPAAPHLSPRTIEAIRNGLYERPEIEGILVNLREGDRVVELGSGAGIVSSIIARNFDDVQVRTFEGNPNLIEHIRRMHAVNDLQEFVEVRNSIVVAEDDPEPVTRFSVSVNFLGSRISEADAGGDARTVEVVNTPYSDLRRSFPHNVLVMDIEGAELGFLAGADLTGIDFLIVELHPTVYGQDKADACIAMIEAAGLVLDPASSTLQVKAFKTPDRMRRGIDTSRVAWRDVPETLAFDPGAERAAEIEIHPGAVLAKGSGLGPDTIAASVFDADQREVPTAISWIDSERRATHSRHHPRLKRVTDLDGTWVFGGVLDPEAPDAVRQFLARLWCLPHLEGEALQGVVFFPSGSGNQAIYDAFLAEVSPLWSPEVAPLILKGPSRFERLIVPPQAVAGGRLRHGTSEFRAFVRACAVSDPPTGSDGRLLLVDSRADVSVISPALQAVLTDAGYMVCDLAEVSLGETTRLIRSSAIVLAAGTSAEDLMLYLAPHMARIGTLDAATPGSGEDFETLASLYGFAHAHRIAVAPPSPAFDPVALDHARLHLSVQGFL